MVSSLAIANDRQRHRTAETTGAWKAETPAGFDPAGASYFTETRSGR
jgi:hypothetical protein